VEILIVPFGSIKVRTTISLEPPTMLIQIGEEVLVPQDELRSMLEILEELILVNFESSPKRAQLEEE